MDESRGSSDSPAVVSHHHQQQQHAPSSSQQHVLPSTSAAVHTPPMVTPPSELLLGGNAGPSGTQQHHQMHQQQHNYASASPAHHQPQRSQASSRVSLAMNDHYDQYVGTSTVAPATTQNAPNPGVSLAYHRRCTLANSRDLAAAAAAAAAASPTGRPAQLRGTGPPAEDAISYAGESAEPLKKAIAEGPVEPRGSLPDVSELSREPLILGREECSRLSSQRRQELQRIAEEAELLRNNPLRYLFHPAVKVGFTPVKLWKGGRQLVIDFRRG